MNEETKQPVDGGDGREHKKEKPHKLHEEIDKLRVEKDELFGKLQRLSADYMNHQKRSAKLISESIAYEKEVIIKSLLPILDNFEHTLSGAENMGEIDSFRKGVKIVYDQMLSILKSHGIEQISSIGQKFDPSCHQAIMQETDAGKEDGIILKELVKGYRLGEKVIRPARVVVNKLMVGKVEPKKTDKEDSAQRQNAAEDNDEDYTDEDRE
jgi:molecular chaperone GrpE